MGLNNRRKYLRIFKIHEIEYENSLVEYYAEKLKLKEAIIVAERIADEVVINKVSPLQRYLYYCYTEVYYFYAGIDNFILDAINFFYCLICFFCSFFHFFHFF